MTTYHPHKILLSDGQKVSLAQAFGRGEAVTLRFKNEALTGGSDTLHLTSRQIEKIQRAKKNKTGADINMSKTQIRRTRPKKDKTSVDNNKTQTRNVRAKKSKTGADVKKSKTAQGSGMQVKRPPTGGKGMRINPPPYMRPPPFIGSWGDQKKAYLR